MKNSTHMLDFGFAFNDKDFSDRVLHLQIISNPKVCLHISSPILAANSSFFYKLFKNDMMESSQKDVTLRINSTEEMTALMDVLGFMYSNILNATSTSDLLAVLMASDKFQVTSCMKHCIQLLLEMPISLDLAILFIDLPPSLLENEIVQPLKDASNKALVTSYLDFSKSQEKAMELPFSALEVVLGSDDLKVDSEDDIFNFILEWVRAHYLKLEERREILTKHLTCFIRFPYMSCLKLKEVLVCPDFDHEQVSKLVSDALISKVEVPYGQHPIAPRAYMYRLIKVVPLEFPQPRSIVYFNLTKDECKDLFSSKLLDSQTFLLGGKSLFLSAQCKGDDEPHTFGLFVYKGKGTKTCNLDFELAVMNKSSSDFVSKLRVKNCALDIGWGISNLLGIPWIDFIKDDCDYFINDILHLRVSLTLNNSQV